MANPYTNATTAQLRNLRDVEQQTRTLASKIKDRGERTRLVGAADRRIKAINAELRKRG